MINIFAKKVGMSHIYNEKGSSIPITILQTYDSCVIEKTINKSKNFDNILLAFDKLHDKKKTSKSVSGVFLKKNLPIYRKIYGCKVAKNSSYSVGDQLVGDQLIELGDFISVSGKTIGKGFSGVMKRHNFGGLEASHGVSVSHRSHGSTGQRQDPGKVFKGKKMAGHMGVDKITIKNLEVLIVDKDNKIIGIKGSVPGKSGSNILIKLHK